MTPSALVARHIRAAMRSLPREYADSLDNVEIVVARAPSRFQHRRLGRDVELYGLYEGIPLTRRGEGYGNTLPDIITIFWEPLVRDFGEGPDLAEQVRRTVYHEIAHHFGISDAELEHSRVR
jgi:predicted Zn-dependent protease with MMP-like domain